MVYLEFIKPVAVANKMFVIFSLIIFLIRFQIWNQVEDTNDYFLLFYDGAVSLFCRYSVAPGMRAGKTRSVPTRW